MHCLVCRFGMDSEKCLKHTKQRFRSISRYPYRIRRTGGGKCDLSDRDAYIYFGWTKARYFFSLPFFSSISLIYRAMGMSFINALAWHRRKKINWVCTTDWCIRVYNDYMVSSLRFPLYIYIYTRDGYYIDNNLMQNVNVYILWIHILFCVFFSNILFSLHDNSKSQQYIPR